MLILVEQRRRHLPSIRRKRGEREGESAHMKEVRIDHGLEGS